MAIRKTVMISDENNTKIIKNMKIAIDKNNSSVSYSKIINELIARA